MKTRSIIAALVTLVSVMNVNAKQLNASQALSRVMKNSVELASVGNSRSAGMELAGTASKGGVVTAYYFRNSQSGEFMVVSADDEKEALLGYADKSTNGTVPPALAKMVEFYGMEQASEVKSESRAARTYEMRRDIEPLLSTVWGQGYPFNMYAPVVDGEQTPSGCVATVLAQAMRHQQWPAKGKGSVSYYSTTTTAQTPRQKLSVKFDTVQFAWDQIADSYHNGYTEAQAEAAGAALRAVGAGVKTNYAPGASSSSFMTAATSLIKYFDYAESVCYIERDYFEYDQWESKIYNELREGYPVPYSASSSIEGHAFLIDGYRQGGYFHILWGWDGQFDGWYKLTALNPKASSVRLASSIYDTAQNMIIGMRPSTEQVKPSVHLRVSGNFSAQQTSTMRVNGAEVVFQGQNGIFSMAYSTSTVTLGVRLIDAEGNETYCKSSTPSTFSQFSAVQTYKVAQSEFPKEGTYEVSPVFMTSDGEWEDVALPLNKVRSIYLTASANQLVFSSSSKVPNLEVSAPELESPVMIGANYSMRATIANSGEEFMDKIYPVVVKNGAVVAKGTGVVVNIAEEESGEYTFSGSMSRTGSAFVAGNYHIALAKVVDSQYEIISPVSESYVGEAKSGVVSASSSAVSVDGVEGEYSTATSPISVYGTQISMSFDVNCHEGYFGQNVGVYVYRAANRSAGAVLSMGDRFVGVEEGNSKTATFTADVTDLEPGVVYMVEPWSSASGRLNSQPTYFRIGVAGVDSVDDDNDSEVIGKEVYNFAGQYMGASEDGLAAGSYIVKEKMANGQERVIKVMRR